MNIVSSNLRAWRIRRYLRRRGFKIYSRRQWGSIRKDVYAQRRRTRPVRVDPADTLVQHITVTRPTGDFKADVRVVERIGWERFGSGVSYNYLINMETGEIAEGMPLDAKGTHTVNDKDVPGYSYDQNHAARAIAGVGMPDTPFTVRAEAALIALQRAMVKYRALTPTYDYKPHSFFAWKDCPCDALRNALGRVRTWVVVTPRRRVRNLLKPRR